MRKYFKALLGLPLFALYKRIFDISVFEGQRVAIIGPASSTVGTKKGEFIDNFDIVIRINKAAHLVASSKHDDDIGKKTDILFHSFYENDFSGGGELDFELFRKLGIRYVINPRNTFEGRRCVYNFYKKYLSRQKVYILPRNMTKEIGLPLGEFRPTTGYAAIVSVLRSNFAELYISGFTFFRTAYTDGYRDDLKSAVKAQEHIKKAKLHDPDLEFENFKVLLAACNQKHIHFDAELTKILEREGIHFRS